jgi:CheY-like chemotaxis protein
MKHDQFRILIVEDRAEDRELIERELNNGKILFISRWVDNRDAFLKEVKEFAPDLVLSDFALPQFDAMEALSILRRYSNETPMILVTGAASEEIAMECMKRGAEDFVLKSALRRLPSAVLNAMRGRTVRRAKESAERSLREQEAQARLIAEHTLDLIYLLDLKGQFLYASPSFKKALGWTLMTSWGKRRSCSFIRMTKTWPRPRFRRPWNRGAIGQHRFATKTRRENGACLSRSSPGRWMKKMIP